MPKPSPLNPATTTTFPSGTTEATEAQLLDNMTRVDTARAAQDSANPIDQAIAGEPPGVEVPAEPVADPAMVATLGMLVSTGIQVLHVKYKWTDPGDEWKKQVATLAALLIDRYVPNALKGQGEITALAVLIGVYAIENVVRQSTTSDSDPGTEGKREDDFISPAPDDELTRFPHPA